MTLNPGFAFDLEQKILSEESGRVGRTHKGGNNPAPGAGAGFGKQPARAHGCDGVEPILNIICGEFALRSQDCVCDPIFCGVGQKVKARFIFTFDSNTAMRKEKMATTQKSVSDQLRYVADQDVPAVAAKGGSSGKLAAPAEAALWAFCSRLIHDCPLT
ncbi:hypothetical protein EVAR_44353_1 [Eumeta japonica]|uniref:Uncharacterized protein n=1 Tax=Eumeta variegata TaxID=151549 RepID=A0A4C1X7G4_EUMVA|nr:hypothetical protein EVAR_44353_1 [Eumeta japonica]